MSIEVELVGGPADGKVVALERDEYLTRPLMVPMVPSVREMFEDYAADQPTFPRILTYEWDGTVRDDGVRRFRLVGMTRPVWD